MVFCNINTKIGLTYRKVVTILILIDGFLQFDFHDDLHHKKVTILILIDGFLQYKLPDLAKLCYVSHNPYFNRWFSAIKQSMN